MVGQPANAAPGTGDPRLTEARNPRTVRIDRVDTSEIVGLMQAEDRAVLPAVEAEAPQIARLIDLIADRLFHGGRLFYLGAGTSGRLGVLDASECPPTFGTPPDLVQGIMAGGAEALTRSLEGAEDDRRAAVDAIRERAIGASDVVVGIATSGTTPFVHAGLEEAATRGAKVAFLSCTEPPESMRKLAEVCVTPLVGAEVIAGSTRLKAGTATKLVLNTLTTGAMIRLGKVHGNLMVDMRAVSRKLVDRGLRIVQSETGRDLESARGLLRRAGGGVRTALAMHHLATDRAMAERWLDTVGGSLAEAISRYGERRPSGYSGYRPHPDPEESHDLIARFDRGPAIVSGALDRARESGPAATPRAWSEAQHVAHLLEFETTAVKPRVAGWLTRDVPPFADLDTARDPRTRGRSSAELLLEFGAEREQSTRALRRAGPGALARAASIGGETLTLAQFISGVAAHDRAHALRIEERPHPSLFVGAP